MTVLWRAARSVEPYFGQGSFWTASETFAGRFRLWLDQTYLAVHEVYSADVDLVNVLEFPFSTWMPSGSITERVPQFAARGYRWVTFYEGVFEGGVTKQYVYLGDDPVPASCRS